MPRRIDHAARKSELVEALWSVIHEQGVSAVSLRTVSAAAGLSVGSLRHSFPTRSALLTSAAQLMIDNVTQRVKALDENQPAISYATKVLLQLVPTDRASHSEMEINIALIAEAGAERQLVAIRDEARHAISRLCRRMLELLRPEIAPDEIARRARRLHVLIDGLALHLVQLEPGAQATWAESVIRSDLEDWLNL